MARVVGYFRKGSTLSWRCGNRESAAAWVVIIVVIALSLLERIFGARVGLISWVIVCGLARSGRVLFQRIGVV